MNSPQHFSRRSFLRTLGGAAVGAPFVANGFRALAGSGQLSVKQAAPLQPNAAAVPETASRLQPSRKHIVTLWSHPDVEPHHIINEYGLHPEPRHIYRHRFGPNPAKGFAVEMDEATIKKLRSDKRVRAVEADAPIAPSPIFLPQVQPTGIKRMGIPGFPPAHINKINEPLDVDVAVMDTGIDSAHFDLNVYQSAGFADPGYNGLDWDGHGTHVAGILGAIDNLQGVVGVAPGVRLWSVQVLGPTQADWSNFLAGINYIAEHADQISVVNASLGSATNNNPFVAIDQAVQSLVDQGIVFVAAAGNNGVDITGPDGVYGTPDDVLPAALPEVMAVSAMDPQLNVIADLSNFSKVAHSPSYVTSPGMGIDVTAPGVHIFSTYLTTTGSGYGYLDGTSMAAPHVSGLVALYIAANGRGHTAQDVYNIRQAIVDNSQPQSAWPGYPNTSGPNNSPEPLAFPSENWVPRPNILRAEMTPDGFQISFPTVPGYTYTPQYTDSLMPPQWNDLSASVCSGGSSLNTNTIALPSLNPTGRWYRVVRAAAP